MVEEECRRPAKSHEWRNRGFAAELSQYLFTVFLEFFSSKILVSELFPPFAGVTCRRIMILIRPLATGFTAILCTKSQHRRVATSFPEIQNIGRGLLFTN